MSFYQRKEIKDLIAYFRLTYNPHDETALKRVINYPKRGIGDTTIDRLIVSANQHQVSLWEAISDPAKYLDGKTAATVSNFVTMIQSFQVITQSMSAYEAALHIAQHSGLLKDLYEDKSIEGLNRHENIQELLNGIKEFLNGKTLKKKGWMYFYRISPCSRTMITTKTRMRIQFR